MQRAVIDSETARSTSRATRARSETTEQIALEAARQSAAGTVPVVGLDALAVEYNEVRARMPSGNARTAELTSIVSKMITAASGRTDNPDVQGMLRSTDGGERVAGYAWVYVHPEPNVTPAVVDALLSEPTAFGQYWAIRALRGLARRDPTILDRDLRRRLERYLRELSPGEDRYAELSGLLTESD